MSLTIPLIFRHHEHMLSLGTNYLTRGFWGDESWTALISQLPIKEIIRVTGEDFHPPLYYLIVNAWGNIFSFQEVTVRLISVIFWLLTSLIAFRLSKEFIKKRPHQLAFTSLVLLSPILFTYAFEARSYAILYFLTSFATLAFWKARKEKGYTWRLTYLVLGGLMVYTHYYAWFILASHAFYLLLFERKTIKKLILPALGILVIQLPWLPTLLSQVGEVNRDYWIAPINSRTHLELFMRVAGGDTANSAQLPVAILLALLLIFGITRRITTNKIDKKYLFLLTWLIIPTLLPTLISFKIPVFFYRYLIFSSIPLLLLVVDGLSTLKKPVFLILFSLTTYLYLANDYAIWNKYPYTVREEKAKLYTQIDPGSQSIYTVLPSFAEVMYYLGPENEVLVTPEGLVQFSGKSLLDAYVRLGLTKIEEPTGEYWIIKPGPETLHIVP